MISVKEAINIITSKAGRLDDEKILIEKCLGRINSKNIYANINNPPEDVSSMDGYALNSKSLKKAIMAFIIAYLAHLDFTLVPFWLVFIVAFFFHDWV